METEKEKKQYPNLKPWKPGQSGNPNGRPKGTVSIKDQIRWYLEDNPEEVKKIVKHFVENNKELLWTMLEGSPKSTSEVKSTSIEIDISGADLLLAQQLRERRLQSGQGSNIESDGDDSKPLVREVPN